MNRGDRRSKLYWIDPVKFATTKNRFYMSVTRLSIFSSKRGGL
jgi:hypothetical protein